ncbi:MAG: hypothetical protein ACRELB_16205, partial [Polyangiaceae bacterium]
TTPDEAWRARTSLPAVERERARTRTAALRAEIVEIGRVGEACARRRSMRRMLVECGILSVRRRLVRLADRQLKRARIS